jgi:hypothetical protein
MTTLSKTFLAASTTGFAAGSVIDFGGFSVIPALTAALPLGAVFFGLFMISFMMEKEMAGFDEEEAGKLQLIRCSTDTPAPARKREHEFVRTQTVSKTVPATAA